MNNKIILTIVAVVAVAVCVLLFVPLKVAVSPNTTDILGTSTSTKVTSISTTTTGSVISTTTLSGKITYKNATADLIQVELPFPDAVVGKDFSVIGKARGGWFFEASFPVEVLDKNGKSLAMGIAQPRNGEDWMTSNFVNFKADIKVPQTYIGPATLVLKKDNPSGMPENDASISFPITVEY